MKKALIILCGGLCMMLASSTQSAAQIKFGAIGGLNFNDVTGDDFESDGMAIGFHLGGFVNIGNKIMVEPQLLYVRKGSKLEEGNLNLDYIEIPIWVRYQLESGLNFNAGPYFAFLMGAKADGEDAKDSFTGSDVGVGFGIGYQLAGGLGFAANYNLGLTSIGEEYEIFGETYEIDAKTSNIKVSVSYTFGGRRE